jgi:hypothetical protein
MNARFIYQTHKWLAVAVVAATLCWFISGVIMVLPGSWRTLSPNLTLMNDADPRLSGTPEFDDARVTVPSAIAAVREHTGKPLRITSVKLRRLPGRLAYEVATPERVYLVDGVNGELFALNETLAGQIAAATVGPRTPLGPVTVQRERTSDYRGTVPAYRIPVEDGKGTVLYIGGPPVDVRHSDRLTRTLTPIVGWHELMFLQPWLSGPAVRLTMLVSAIIGTLMSLAGTVILFLQFQRWRRS